MATVPEALVRRLTLAWESTALSYADDEAAGITALSVISWLNDPGNREEAQALLEPFETESQVELLDDLSREAHKVVVMDDDTVVVAHAIGVMQLLEDLVREARANA
jgi:hypothetical protein